MIFTSVLLCSEFKLENIPLEQIFAGKMFAVNFVCGNLFLQIAGKIAKIRTRKTLMQHGRYLPPLQFL